MSEEKDWEDDMLSVRDIARVCGRTEETVRRWIWSGKLRASKLGNQLFVARRDLDALTAPRVAEAAVAYAPGPGATLARGPASYNKAEALAALKRAVAFSKRFKGRFANVDISEMVRESRESH